MASVSRLKLYPLVVALLAISLHLLFIALCTSGSLVRFAIRLKSLPLILSLAIISLYLLSIALCTSGSLVLSAISFIVESVAFL